MVSLESFAGVRIAEVWAVFSITSLSLRCYDAVYLLDANNKLTTRRTNTEHMYTPRVCNVYISAMHNIYPPRIKSIYPVYIRRYRTYDRYQCLTHLVGAMADRNRPRIRLRRRFAMIETSLKPTFNNTFDVPIIQPFRQRVQNVPPNSTLH